MVPRVAIITGGAQGMGEAIAYRLAEDGITVAVMDIKGKEALLEAVVKKVEEKGGKASHLIGDISVEEEVKGAVDKVVEEHGSLDIMVANAGILKYGALVDTPLDEWNQVLTVNTTGAMLCFKYAAIQMIKQGRGGRIIGASSAAGKRAIKNIAAYSASKFAVRGLTQSTAQELRPHKITVNSYAPGLIYTPMVSHPDDAKHGGTGSVAAMTLPDGIGGAGPEVIAELVAYLIKPEAYFVTGQTINIDGGWNFD